ncbi:MAG: ribosome biogenesis GTPase YlqF [Clostridia bacterium]|nr:ribosome biogenesis GTPase YlqF [Clostridia bacterium]
MPENLYQIQWFPGHMAKTRRLIKESLPLVDAVMQLLDARIPRSSQNPEIQSIIENKPNIVLLNKSDVADPQSTRAWIEHFAKCGIKAIPVDCKKGVGIDKIIPAARELLSDKIKLWQQKGMGNRPIRLMVVGIPNVGKSTFINRIARANKAKTADRPGVTRGNQWFSLGKGGEVLDTPGVLWPKFDDEQAGKNLAYTGAIKDAIIDIEGLAAQLLGELKDGGKTGFVERYKLNALKNFNPDDKQGYDLLELIARKRGMLISGGELDTERAAVMVLDEFRAGLLGRITLEMPD